MDTHCNNISYVSKKLNKILSNTKGQNNPIDHIETLVGKFSGENVLEGFAANIEELNSERKDTTNFDENFYQMCIEDNMVIFDFTSDQREKMVVGNLPDDNYARSELAPIMGPVPIGLIFYSFLWPIE